MAINYAADPVWGSDYQRAVSSGDQAYLAKVQRAIDARQPAGAQAGQIMANTLAMGREAPVWANAAPGQQVNQAGQIRQEQAARGWNLEPNGWPGGVYGYRGQQSQMPSSIIGQAPPVTAYTPGTIPPTSGQSQPAAPWGNMGGFGPSVNPYMTAKPSAAGAMSPFSSNYQQASPFASMGSFYGQRPNTGSYGSNPDMGGPMSWRPSYANSGYRGLLG